MAQNSETGHAKNAANFKQLISYVSGYGSDYNPSRITINLVALQTQASKSEGVISNVNKFLPPWNMAVASREIAFEPLSKLTTRVLNSLKATDTSEQIDDTAKAIVRKIQGQRAGTKIAPSITDEKQEKQISVSQMSFDSRLDNFDKLIQFLISTPEYAPNEEEIKVTTLEAYYDELKIKNDAVITATVDLSNARIARDETLYAPKTGTVDVAFDTKVYIKSLYGATSPQYKQVSGLEFKSTPK